MFDGSPQKNVAVPQFTPINFTYGERDFFIHVVNDMFMLRVSEDFISYVMSVQVHDDFFIKVVHLF
jgi:hypothetical protein